MDRNVMIAALAAALVGVFVGAIIMIAFFAFWRRSYRRRELPEFAFITTPRIRGKSYAGWKSPSSQSISLHSPSSTLKKKISEPMLLKNFEGKGVILPPHISEMLGISSKQACSKIPPLLSLDSTTTLRELSVESEIDETSRQPGVPMLLRQPRKSARSLRRGFGSIHSIASAESTYSEASAPSVFISAAPYIPPESSLVLSAPCHGRTFELVPVYKSEQPDTRLTPSAAVLADASAAVLDQSRKENSHFSPPGLSGHYRPLNIGPPHQVPLDHASRSKESTSPLPDIPPRSPLRWKSVPNLK